MPKATIKTESGAVITVEGSEREVSTILADLKSVHSVEAPGIRKAALRKEKTRPAGPLDLVVELRAGSFFEKARTLGEIARALEERGYLIPTTTLSGVVLSLLKKGQLHRKKIDGVWNYGK